MCEDQKGEVLHLIIGAAMGLAYQYASNVITNKIAGDSWRKSFSIKKEDVPSLLGATVSGALATTGISLNQSQIAGGLFSGVSYIATQKMKHEKIDPCELACDVASGCASGYLGGKGMGAKKMFKAHKAYRKILKKAHYKSPNYRKAVRQLRRIKGNIKWGFRDIRRSMRFSFLYNIDKSIIKN